jgi:hypothetical protein
MTSIINNSNANSALINTINASESKMNPNVYSTKRIYPAAATTYVKTSKTNGAVATNQVITFDLMKYGICQQLLFCYKKTYSAASGGNAANGKIYRYDWIDVIDRIELLSSSKVIDTLTKYDLIAHFSNLDAAQYNLVNKGLLGERTKSVAQKAINAKDSFVVPLVFGFFKDINTNLNLQFNEPMSVRVRFGSRFDGGVTDAGAAQATSISDTDVYLKVRYKAYNEADFSEILAQNYNEPELSVMSSGFYDENIVNITLENTDASDKQVSNGENGTPVELKNTDCVNDFYVIVRRSEPPTDAATKPNLPLPISRVVMTASGQEIFDLEAEELLYSKLCENGNSILAADETADDAQNVVKIQTGLWEYSGGGTQSNTLSLRELNNPIIRVYFNDSVTANSTQTYEVVVVEDTVKIYSTTSSTGRVQTSLTN